MKLVTFALLCAAQAARAQAPDPAALEASGSKHYELAEYAAAIADFKEAFRISDRPELLFNIAQAYRLAGDCRQAQTFYKTFLRRVPGAPNAPQIRGRIDELEACAAKAPVPPTPVAAPSTAPAPNPAPNTRPPATPSRTWKTPAGLGIAGGGVLGVGLGVVFAAKGASKRDELRDACAVECTAAVARSLDDAGAAANRNAAIGLIAGGALLATGVVLVILDRPRAESVPVVSVGATGATASWSWRF